MSSQWIELPKTGGGGVTSLNGLTGALTLAAGTNITLVPSGNTITINSSGGGITGPTVSPVHSLAIWNNGTGTALTDTNLIYSDSGTAATLQTLASNYSLNLLSTGTGSALIGTNALNYFLVSSSGDFVWISNGGVSNASLTSLGQLTISPSDASVILNTNSAPTSPASGYLKLFTSDGVSFYTIDSSNVTKQIQTTAGSTGVFGPATTTPNGVALWNSSIGALVQDSPGLTFTLLGSIDWKIRNSNSSGSLILDTPLLCQINAGNSTGLVVSAGIPGGQSANVLLGGGVTNASSNGFAYIASSTGAPTGTPIALTGYTPLYVDNTNNVISFYSGGQWRQTVTPGGSSGDVQVNNGSGGFGAVTGVATFTSNNPIVGMNIQNGVVTSITDLSPTPISDNTYTTGFGANSSGNVTTTKGIITAVNQADNSSALGSFNSSSPIVGLIVSNGFVTSATDAGSTFSGTITTAALTLSGSQGSMTFTNGILTSQTAAT